MSKTLGEKGVIGEKLYACPLCKRSGFSAPGIKNHRCPAIPKIHGRRRRLDPLAVEKILNS